jgi:hypothetical protein
MAKVAMIETVKTDDGWEAFAEVTISNGSSENTISFCSEGDDEQDAIIDLTQTMREAIQEMQDALYDANELIE